MKQYFDSDEYHEDHINGKIEQDRQMQAEQDKQMNDQINKQMYEDMRENEITPVYTCKWKSADDFLTECGLDKEEHPLHIVKSNLATLIEVYVAAKILDLKGRSGNVKELTDLYHYRDSTVGLYATDRPDKVIDPSEVLFKLEYHE